MHMVRSFSFHTVTTPYCTEYSAEAAQLLWILRSILYVLRTYAMRHGTTEQVRFLHLSTEYNLESTEGICCPHSSTSRLTRLFNPPNATLMASDLHNLRRSGGAGRTFLFCCMRKNNAAARLGACPRTHGMDSAILEPWRRRQWSGGLMQAALLRCCCL